MGTKIITPKRASEGMHTVNVVIHKDNFDLFISGAFLEVGIMIDDAGNCYTYSYENGEPIEIEYREGEWGEDLKEIRILRKDNIAFITELVENYEYKNPKDYFQHIAEFV